MKMEPMPRPAYLDEHSPLAAMISYHSERARLAREQLTEQMMFDLETDFHQAGVRPDPEQWWSDLEELKWEDGSVCAVWRDTMRFHERCVERLTHG